MPFSSAWRNSTLTSWPPDSAHSTICSGAGGSVVGIDIIPVSYSDGAASGGSNMVMPLRFGGRGHGRLLSIPRFWRHNVGSIPTL